MNERERGEIEFVVAVKQTIGYKNWDNPFTDQRWSA